jgi:long-chain acyl-CoA synthetase
VDENIRPGLDYFGRLLDDGWNVLIFPEGQLNRGDRGIQTLRGGTGVIAVEMQVPVVPMTIEGTETIIPPDRLLPRRVGTVTVRFGEPVAIDGAAGYAAATNAIAAAMREVLEAGCVNR